MLEYDPKAVKPPDHAPVITSTVNVAPAGIVYLHNRAKRGEADHYGVQMFSFEITPEIAAVSPYLQVGDKVYLLYRKVQRP